MANRQFFEDILTMDKAKATKYIIYGLFIAIIFSAIMIVSVSLDANANNIHDFITQINQQLYYNQEIGFNEYMEMENDYQMMEDFLDFQDVIFGNIARVGINIGVAFLVLGFIGYATNDKLDDRTRLASMILAGAILFVMVFALVGSMQVTIT